MRPPFPFPSLPPLSFHFQLTQARFHFSVSYSVSVKGTVANSMPFIQNFVLRTICQLCQSRSRRLRSFWSAPRITNHLKNPKKKPISDWPIITSSSHANYFANQKTVSLLICFLGCVYTSSSNLARLETFSKMARFPYNPIHILILHKPFVQRKQISEQYWEFGISPIILKIFDIPLREKFLQFDWLSAVVFQLKGTQSADAHAHCIPFLS